MSEVVDFNCCKCSEHVTELHWYEPIPTNMKKHVMCFSCNYWRELVGNKESIIVEGVHYMDGGPTSSKFKGFGGSKFTYVKGGVKTVTDNMWYQGEIPKHWRSEFPDNAVWVKEEPKASDGPF